MSGSPARRHKPNRQTLRDRARRPAPAGRPLHGTAYDRPTGIAQKSDSDDTYVDTDPNLLPLGTVLKTYPKGTLQYATLPPKKGS